MNNVVIAGRLVCAPILRRSQQGRRHLAMEVAVPRSDGWTADTLDVTWWSGWPEDYHLEFHRGRAVSVAGRLQSWLRTLYTGRGQPVRVRHVTIVAAKVEPLGEPDEAEVSAVRGGA